MKLKILTLLFSISLMSSLNSFAAPLDLVVLRQVGESQIKNLVGKNIEIEGFFLEMALPRTTP